MIFTGYVLTSKEKKILNCVISPRTTKVNLITAFCSDILEEPLKKRASFESLQSADRTTIFFTVQTESSREIGNSGARLNSARKRPLSRSYIIHFGRTTKNEDVSTCEK